MRKEVDHYVRNYHGSQRSQSSRHCMLGVLHPLPIPKQLWEDSCMDFAVGLPEFEGFDAIWLVVDRLPKMRHFVPRHTMSDAPGVAELLIREVVHLHRLLPMILSDRGPQLGSTLWGQVCSRLVIEQKLSTSFHPHTDSRTMRMNALMEQYLWVFIKHQQAAWVKWLPMAKFAANNMASETTKCTPLVAINRVDPRMSSSENPAEDADPWRFDADQVLAVMQQIHNHLRVEMRQSQALQDEGAYRGQILARSIKEGSHLWLDAWNIRTTRPSRKLDWKWCSPFLVVCRVSPFAYE